MPRRDDLHYREVKGHDYSRIAHPPVEATYLRDKDGRIEMPHSVTSEGTFFHVDAAIYPYGITLVQVSITLKVDAAYSLVYEKWRGDPPIAIKDIATVTTGAGDSYKEVLAINMDDSLLLADDYIFLHIPSTVVAYVHCKIIFTINMSS